MTHYQINLGCGSYYDPQSINIDLYDRSVADVIAHVGFLPFKSDTIDHIKAIHLLEHFDWVTIKYLLLEWSRTLKVGGILEIEVPDFQKSAKKLVKKSRKLNSAVPLLQWIFGSEELGMRHHRIGFTTDLLIHYLKMASFAAIKKRKAKNHPYQSGIKIICQKKAIPTIDPLNRVITSFRLGLINKILTREYQPLTVFETALDNILINSGKGSEAVTLSNIIIKLLIFNPKLAESFIDTLEEHLNNSNSLASSNHYLNNFKTVATFFKDCKFHKRLITLWQKRKKSYGSFMIDYTDLLNYLEVEITEIIFKQRANQLTTFSKLEKKFAYICSLTVEDIPFFSEYFIVNKSLILFSKAIKEFKIQNYPKSIGLLKKSLKLNPDSIYALWNLGRLYYNQKNNKKSVEYYQLAIAIAKRKKQKKLIKTIQKEYQEVRDFIKAKKEDYYPPITNY